MGRTVLGYRLHECRGVRALVLVPEAQARDSTVIKAALIGAGYIAREHLDCLKSLKTARLVGLCDSSPVMAEATAEEYSVPRWFSDHRKMLDDLKPDVVHITTPPQSHFSLASDVLENGAHAFVEKPITLDSGDFSKLRTLAAERQLLLLEDYNYLFNSSVRRILNLIARGEFGEVVHVEVLFCANILGRESRHTGLNSPFLSLPGGAVADFVTHLAYLAHAYIGEHRAVRTTWHKRSEIAGIQWDEFRAFLDAERGTGVLAFSAHSQPDMLWLRVHGTKMRATANLFEPLLAIERLREGPRPLATLINGLSVAGAYTRSSFGGVWRKLRGRPVTYEGLWWLLKHFYESMEAGSEPPLSIHQIESVNRLVWDLLNEQNRL